MEIHEESIPRFRRLAVSGMRRTAHCWTHVKHLQIFPSKWKYLGTGFFRALWVRFISESRNVLWSSVEKPLFWSLRLSPNQNFLEFYVNITKPFFCSQKARHLVVTKLLKAPNLSPNITFQTLPNNAPINSKHPIPRHLNFWRLANSTSRPRGQKAVQIPTLMSPSTFPWGQIFSFNQSLFVLWREKYINPV